MPQICTICIHDNLAIINAELKRRPLRLPLRALAALTGTSKDALMRHQQNHLPRDPEPESEPAQSREWTGWGEAPIARPRYEPVRFLRQGDEPEPPQPAIVRTWTEWSVGGRKYLALDPLSGDAPGYTPVWKGEVVEGIQYIRPQVRCVTTWED